MMCLLKVKQAGMLHNMCVALSHHYDVIVISHMTIRLSIDNFVFYTYVGTLQSEMWYSLSIETL